MQPVWVSTLLPTLTCWGGRAERRRCGHPITQTVVPKMNTHTLYHKNTIIRHGTSDACWQELVRLVGNKTLIEVWNEGYRIKPRKNAWPKIEKFPACGFRVGTLWSSVTVDEINDILGFRSQYGDKSEHEWSFRVQLEEGGEWYECGIWDYYKNRWSIYGELAVFEALFPNKILNHRQRESV